jgi:hypothetical protein
MRCGFGSLQGLCILQRLPRRRSVGRVSLGAGQGWEQAVAFCVCVCLGMRGRLLSSASERDDDASGSGIGRGGDWPRSGLVQQPRTGLSPRKHHPRGLRRGPVASEYAVRPVCFAARDIDHCCSAFCALPSRNGTFTPQRVIDRLRLLNRERRAAATATCDYHYRR